MALASATGPVPRHLLPDNTEISPEGRMSVGGVDLVELAAEFGTPLFVYDEEHLRSRCREAVQVFGPGVAYATKAFLCVAMAKLAHEEGMHLDVATLGELHVARAAGVPPSDLVFHGNNKSGAELVAAMQAGVGPHRHRQLRRDCSDRSHPRRHRADRSGASAHHSRCRSTHARVHSNRPG